MPPIAPPMGWAALSTGERIVHVARQCAARHVHVELLRCARDDTPATDTSLELLRLAVAKKTLDALRGRPEENA
jgi:hypothetical protein